MLPTAQFQSHMILIFVEIYRVFFAASNYDNHGYPMWLISLMWVQNLLTTVSFLPVYQPAFLFLAFLFLALEKDPKAWSFFLQPGKVVSSSIKVLESLWWFYPKNKRSHMCCSCEKGQLTMRVIYHTNNNKGSYLTNIGWLHKRGNFLPSALKKWKRK